MAEPKIVAAIAKLMCLRIEASNYLLVTNWRPNRLAVNSCDGHHGTAVEGSRALGNRCSIGLSYAT
jgi:hypothetical protein